MLPPSLQKPEKWQFKRRLLSCQCDHRYYTHTRRTKIRRKLPGSLAEDRRFYDWTIQSAHTPCRARNHRNYVVSVFAAVSLSYICGARATISLLFGLDQWVRLLSDDRTSRTIFRGKPERMKSRLLIGERNNRFRSTTAGHANGAASRRSCQSRRSQL